MPQERTFESQAFAADQRWRGTEAKMEADRHIGARAVEFGRDMENRRRYEQEFALRRRESEVQERQSVQDFQLRAQQAQVEMKHRALQTVEMQRRLQLMAQINEVEAAEVTLESQRLQNERMRIEVDKLKSVEQGELPSDFWIRNADRSNIELEAITGYTYVNGKKTPLTPEQQQRRVKQLDDLHAARVKSYENRGGSSTPSIEELRAEAAARNGGQGGGLLRDGRQPVQGGQESPIRGVSQEDAPIVEDAVVSAYRRYLDSQGGRGMAPEVTPEDLRLLAESYAENMAEYVQGFDGARREKAIHRFWERVWNSGGFDRFIQYKSTQQGQALFGNR